MPIIELKLDSSGAVEGLGKYDKAVKKSERVTESSFNKIRKHVNSIGTVAAVGFAAVGTALIPLIKNSLQAASTMNETQGVFEKAFAGMMGKADEWSNDLRENYHLSEQASKEYLNNLQLVLTGMGKTGDAAGKMSHKLVTVGAELAAAFDKKTVDVVRDIRSALSGSMETMDKYGVVVRQAQVNQKALEMGLAATTKEITQADRATAMYQLILDKTATTTGTVADEFNGWAGQIAEAEKNISDITTAIGQRLMPVFLPLLQKFNEWIGVSERVDQISKILVNTLDFLADGVRGVGIFAQGLIVVFTGVADQLANLLIPLDLVLTGLEKLNLIDSNPVANFRDVLSDLADSSLESLNKKLEEAISKTGGFSKALDESNRKAKEAAALQKHNAEVLGIVGDSAKKAAEDLKKMEKAGVDAGTKPQPPEVELKKKIDAVTASAKSSTSALNSQAAAADKVAAAARKISSSGRTSASKEGTYKASAAWSGGSKSMGSGGFDMTPEEINLYKSLTPGGRGNHYWNSGKIMGPMGYSKGTKNIHKNLDRNLLQSKNAMNTIFSNRNGGQGATNIFNFNQQVSRSDVFNISDMMKRNGARA